MSIIINYSFILPIFWNRNKKYYLSKNKNITKINIMSKKYTHMVKIPDIYNYKTN
jgi:hypothetical protein